eukprot:scaffold223336_cov20-Tisochrysis_lutea.AAC.1
MEGRRMCECLRMRMRTCMRAKDGKAFNVRVRASSKSMNRSPLDAAVLHDAHLKPVDDDQKSFVLQVALKCADLGHLSAPRNVHR